MTKLISILIAIILAWVGWSIFTYYREIAARQETEQRAAVGADIDPAQLPGLPPELHQSLDSAQRRGTAALGEFLAAHSQRIQDPRRAWIELDYSIGLFRKNPREAKRVFAAVKTRTSTNSIVYPRIRQLERTFILNSAVDVQPGAD